LVALLPGIALVISRDLDARVPYSRLRRRRLRHRPNHRKGLGRRRLSAPRRSRPAAGRPICCDGPGLAQPARGGERFAGWLHSGVPLNAVFADADGSLIRSIGVALVAGLLVLGSAWTGANMLVLRPIEVLVGASRRLQAGELSARTELSAAGGELGQLGQALD